ncbi:MAG: hypothetical protein U0401_15325 [Anaerolineae bacterium]
MKSHFHHLIGGVVLSLTLLAGAIRPISTVQAGTELPPRATPTPAPSEKDAPQKENPTGAFIELQAAPSGSWGVVQWQDSAGAWHPVEGWQGTLPASGRWWVHPKDFGTGPFRWAVFAEPGGRLVGVSQPFHLPAGANTLQAVVVP